MRKMAGTSRSVSFIKISWLKGRLQNIIFRLNQGPPSFRTLLRWQFPVRLFLASENLIRDGCLFIDWL